jgi:hypothetical protein
MLFVGSAQTELCLASIGQLGEQPGTRRQYPLPKELDPWPGHKIPDHDSAIPDQTLVQQGQLPPGAVIEVDLEHGRLARRL